jgi:hypothetical protein
MIQDVPPDELPSDAAWEIIDGIPGLGIGVANAGATVGGRFARRGGWMYATEDISTDATSAAYVTAMGYLKASNRVCLMTDNNKFGYFTPATAAADFTLVSTAGLQALQPYVDAFGKLILTNSDGTTALKYYDGTTFGTLAGTPPTAKYAAVWKDRLILGGTAALPRRTYFSALGDPTVWDTTNSYVDTNRNITGYAVLPNALLIFSDNQTARIRGSVPPPGSPDMAKDDPIFNTGCTFANSIAVNGVDCAFANEEGVFLTNGTSQPQDLTAICGVKTTWQNYMATRVPTGVTLNDYDNVYGGFIGDYYLAVVHESHVDGQAAVPAFLFNIVTRSCTKLDNFHADSVVMTPQVGDDLYLGIDKRVVSVKPIFTTTVTNAQDANGSGPNLSLTTRYYLDAKSFNKRWKTAYLDYSMLDNASSNPTLAVTYYPHWQDTTGSVTLASALAETTAAQGTIRAKMPIRKKARGGYFKIVQTNASKSTVIGALLADVHAMEGGRVS